MRKIRDKIRNKLVSFKERVTDQPQTSVLDKLQIQQIHNKKLILVRKFCIVLSFFNFLFQVNAYLRYFVNKNYEVMPKHMALIQLVYWVSWLVVVILIIISMRQKDSLNLVYSQVTILLMRNILSMLDFEEKRFDETIDLNMFIILQLWTVTILGITMNFLMSNKVRILLTQTSNAFTSVLGAIIMERKL